MIKPDTLVFIANGGKGRRLHDHIPSLKDGILPKGLAVEYKQAPLIKQQLTQIAEAFRLSQFVLSFTREESINQFEKMITQGLLPALDYIYTLNTYTEHDTGTDVFMNFLLSSNTSFANYSTVIESSGDLLVSDDVFSLPTSDINYICEKDLLPGTHQPNMKNIQFKTDEAGLVVGFETTQHVPNKILGHPMFLTPSCAELKRDMPRHSSNRLFVMRAIEEGHDFKIIKPSVLINVNTPQDLKNLNNISSL